MPQPTLFEARFYFGAGRESRMERVFEETTERRTPNRLHSMFDVGCSAFGVFFNLMEGWLSPV